MKGLLECVLCCRDTTRCESRSPFAQEIVITLDRNPYNLAMEGDFRPTSIHRVMCL